MTVPLSDRSSFELDEVFTPSTPAVANYVPRHEEVTAKLVNAIRTRGKQIVIYGHSGTGKTTLLINKLNELYEDHITSRCMKTTTYDQLILDAFGKLEPFYTAERSRTSTKQVASKFEGLFDAIKLSIQASIQKESSTKEVRLVPPQLTAENLANLLGSKRLCWIIEDFHKVSTTEKSKLAQCMKVFMDCAADHPEVKIITLGAVQTARQVVECDPEMANRVSEIEVSLMKSEEIEHIIENGERLLKIRFPRSAKKLISQYSHGVPAVCHQLCLNACNAAGVERTGRDLIDINEQDLKKAVETYVSEASDSLKAKFEKVLKKPTKTKINYAREIISIMSASSADGLDRSAIIRKFKIEFSVATDITIRKTLDKLTKPELGELLRFNENTNIYFFSDPIYHVYANTVFYHNNRDSTDVSGIEIAEMSTSNLIKLLSQELSKAIRLDNSKGSFRLSLTSSLNAGGSVD